MSTLPTFVNGSPGSASQMMQALQFLYNLGESNLDSLSTVRTETLLALQRRISYLNCKQQESKKLVNQNALVNFAVTDFSNIDQSETTATVRVDSSVVTCSEQALEVEAIIKSIVFTSSIGSIETIDTNSNIYRVYNTNNQTPTGTFKIVLREAINLSVIVFDLPSIASNPVITVSVSDTDITYTPCLSYSLNGYRLIVYLNPAEIQYIKLTITPSHPDNLGGSLFTFGITDFVGSSTKYRLLSSFVTKPMSFKPISVNCQLLSINTDGLLFFLALNNSDFVEINLDTPIAIPGVSKVTLSNATLNGSGLLSQGITSTTYKQTVSVIDNSTGLIMPLVSNLTGADANIVNLDKAYISMVGNNLYYVPYVSDDSTKTFNISFIEGPPNITAQLKVQLSTSDRNSSPIFNGATLLPV